MSRFRLRFLLQEFDLLPGEAVIGRSPDCHITIEDPLISRQHARIVVENGAATFYDLASRNGLRINGRPVSEPTRLADGDRIRLGAQELVFVRVALDQRLTRSTGAMRLCAVCKTPFPEGPSECPHCGHPVTSVREEDTMSGISVPVRRAWILQMLGDVLDRALRSNKLHEADRMLRRAAEETEDRLLSGDIDATHLGRISDYALTLSRLKADPHWALWVLDMHRRSRRVPQSSTVTKIREAIHVPGVRSALSRFVDAWNLRGEPVTEDDAPQLAELERLAEGEEG